MKIQYNGILGKDIAEIPDNATDWRIIGINGVETVVCIVDGKIITDDDYIEIS